jgi:hypothetical protein
MSSSSHPNGHHGPVYVGGGEREARAYVAPVVVPSAAAPKSTGEKVAISSTVDPRRMQTMKLPPGRPRPPLTPDEQPQERPELIAEDAAAAPSNRYPTSGAQINKRPKSAMASATVVRPPPALPTNSGPPAIVWVLAVALAALIGAGTALWLRKGNATPTPAQAVPKTSPDKQAPPTNR